nr:MAG: hypothetical protein 1 [Leviviridae sp.]
MAYGISRDARGRCLNDIAVQRASRLRSRVQDGGIPGRCRARFAQSSVEFITESPDIAYERSANVSTIPVQGYRPSTTMIRRPIGRSLCLLTAASKGVTGDGHEYEIEMTDYPVYIPNSIPSVARESIQNRAGPRIARQLQLTEAQYGVLLGEGRETLAHLVLLARRLLEAYNAVRRGRIKDLRRVLQTVHNGKWKPAQATSLWLEYRYGITPLLADIEAVSSDLRRNERKLERLFRVSGGGAASYRFQTDVIGPAILPFSVSGEQTVEGRYGYVLRSEDGYAGFVDGEFRKLSDARAIITRFIDPLSVAWELTPLSFVADWFWTMGDYLSYYGSLYQNVAIVSGYRRYHSFIQPSVVIRLSGTDVSFPGRIKELIPVYERFEETSFPNMTVEFTGDALSLNHWVDTFALLKQSIRRKKR